MGCLRRRSSSGADQAKGVPACFVSVRAVAKQRRLRAKGGVSAFAPTGLSAPIVVVARRWKEYCVVAAVEGHELKTPETEHRPGPERLLETAHLELDGKLFVSTQQAPTWRANCRCFETGGSLSRRVSVPRAPAQMGRARGRARRGERSEEAGVRRERGGNPAAFVFVPRPGRGHLQ